MYFGINARKFELECSQCTRMVMGLTYTTTSRKSLVLSIFRVDSLLGRKGYRKSKEFLTFGCDSIFSQLRQDQLVVLEHVQVLVVLVSCRRGNFAPRHDVCLEVGQKAILNNLCYYIIFGTSQLVFPADQCTSGACHKILHFENALKMIETSLNSLS